MHSGPVTFHVSVPVSSPAPLIRRIGKFRLTKEPMPTAAMWWWVPPSVTAKRSPSEVFTYRTRRTYVPASAVR